MGAVGRILTLAVAASVVCGAVAALAAPEGTLHGTSHADRLVGTKAANVLKGLGGNDTLVGGRGEDTLIGGKGNDKLRGGPGRDHFNMRDGVQTPAPGNDTIYARDGGKDEINCGDGNDVAIVDATEDGVYDCEEVREP
jgi:Ca2+-binding RTX toxin-like protein